VIIYEGPSLIDKEPIVVIARPGHNIKTGNMLKTWILLQDIPPHEAIHDGRDFSICGSCKHRAPERSCYVRVHLEPRTVWEAWRNGKYNLIPVKDWDSWIFNRSNWQYHGNLSVRVGSYGDPGAVPTEVWRELLTHVNHWTGYTHFWRDCDQELRRWCMASVDTYDEMMCAQDKGWRTYRCVSKDIDLKISSIISEEILCPASEEAGRKTTCDKCRLCMGTSVNARSIYIPVHGPGRSNF